MKQSVLIFVFMSIVISSCEKTPFSDQYHDSIALDSIRLGTFVLNNYYQDAKLLYCYEIFQDKSHFNRNNNILDTTEIKKVLKIIQAVYNLDSHESNTVFDVHKIHARLCISLNSIYLKVQTNQPEIMNLSKGIIPTGNQQLDNLLSTYGFDSVRTFYNYPDFPWLTIYSKNEYNMLPIVNQFSSVPSIIQTDWESGICIGDGNTISLTRFPNYARIIFSIGEGDCPAGCIYHKYWEFEVENNKATFIRTFED